MTQIGFPHYKSFCLNRALNEWCISDKMLDPDESISIDDADLDITPLHMEYEGYVVDKSCSCNQFVDICTCYLILLDGITPQECKNNSFLYLHDFDILCFNFTW